MEQVDNQPDKLTFRGWGPCFHSQEEKQQVDEWIDSLRELAGHPAGQFENMDWLAWEIIDLGGSITLDADQWVGVGVEGKFWLGGDRYVPYSIWVESDSFPAAMAGAYAWLLWKATELGLPMVRP